VLLELAKTHFWRKFSDSNTIFALSFGNAQEIHIYGKAFIMVNPRYFVPSSMEAGVTAKEDRFVL